MLCAVVWLPGQWRFSHALFIVPAGGMASCSWSLRPCACGGSQWHACRAQCSQRFLKLCNCMQLQNGPSTVAVTSCHSEHLPRAGPHPHCTSSLRGPVSESCWFPLGSSLGVSRHASRNWHALAIASTSRYVATVPAAVTRSTRVYHGTRFSYCMKSTASRRARARARGSIPGRLQLPTVSAWTHNEVWSVPPCLVRCLPKWRRCSPDHIFLHFIECQQCLSTSMIKSMTIEQALQ